jgi:exodeoxyribonuclease-5
MFAGKIDLDTLAEDDVVLCATHRLARHLRLARDQACLARGLARWRPLAAQTVSQWLSAAATQALLAGDIAAETAPRLVLSASQERLLWERVIADGLGDSPAAELFDLEGLAAAALEANALMETWGIRVAAQADGAGEETRRFLQWRAEFRRRCIAAGWLESARAAAWQADQVAQGAGRLPARVIFAGFDRYTPQEERLARALTARGTMLMELELAGRAPAAAVVSAQADRQAECRAAAAWAAQCLAANPSSRLAIVVPELAAVRDALADALDAVLDPRAFATGGAEMPRRYNFSLGTPLSRQPIAATALAWLRLAANPYAVAQADFGELLRGAYGPAEGSADEADACARLEARMRQRLGPTVSFDRIIRFGRREGRVPRLSARLEALQAQIAGQPARQWPSTWGSVFRRQLTAVGWPGERTLSSHEYQARQAFHEVLDGLIQLDAVLGQVPAGEAVARFSRLCRERVFQPETEGDPAVQVMGLLEAAGGRFDALWVMAMNDDVWPPSPKPNPLLPAQAQRRALSPGSCAEVEGAFAHAIHERLLRSAPAAVFSWAKSEGDRQLRPSPLIAGLAMTEEFLPAPTLAATLLGGGIETLPDHVAPPVAEGEALGGGARLLAAQAVCPAWAFYRYRLAAKALEAPTEGLDSKTRGILLHRVLELFWRERGLDDLRVLLAGNADNAIGIAVDVALGEINGGRDEPLPPRLLALERTRLVGLVEEWLAVEAARSLPFRVAAQEREEEAAIEGIRVSLRVDRIDELPDGRRLIIDYKTGSRVSAGSWYDERIAEPQLPLYAAFAPEGEQVAGVAFAKVRREEMAFVGMTAEDGLLPGMKGREDWPQLLAEWRRRIEAVAREIAAGWAPVSFEKEQPLEFCEVKPLLRLPEARAFRESCDGEESE